MGEIRSTLDIVLEKTKDMGLSPEEMEEMRREEWSTKAKRSTTKYLEGIITLEGLLKGAEEASDHYGEYMRGCIIEELIGSLDFSEKTILIRQGLERLSGKNLKGLFRKIKDTSFSHIQAKQRKRRKVKALLWKKLEERGISGSAVEPNVTCTDEWKEAEKELESLARSRLEYFRAEIWKLIIIKRRSI